MEKIKINIDKFVLFHRKRIEFLEKIVKEEKQGRLIFEISLMGLESLASILHSKEKDPKKRFLLLLKLTTLGDKTANDLWKWRCSLFHQGFVAHRFTSLEGWNEDDIQFLEFPDVLKSTVEYVPEVIILIYKNLINEFEEDTKKRNINKVELYSEFALHFYQ